jgi:Ner family transcriptional regulator
MKPNNSKDWHPAIIVAQLRIQGTSLRQLAKDNGLFPTALSVAIQRPWLKAEGIIAQAIGVTPAQIWPSRYARRAGKEQKKCSSQAIKVPADSIKECSHDCNINVTKGV